MTPPSRRGIHHVERERERERERWCISPYSFSFLLCLAFLFLFNPLSPVFSPAFDSPLGYTCTSRHQLVPIHHTGHMRPLYTGHPFILNSPLHFSSRSTGLHLTLPRVVFISLELDVEICGRAKTHGSSFSFLLSPFLLFLLLQ